MATQNPHQNRCGRMPCRADVPGFRLTLVPASLAAVLILLLSSPAWAAPTAVTGNPAPANEGTGPSITVKATNTHTTYNVVVYSGAISFSATLSDGTVGVPVTFTFTDASGATQTATANSVAGGVAGASFTPAAPGACTCQASATGYTSGSSGANSLQVEYFYNGQQIPSPLADLPVPQKSESDVNVDAVPASVPIVLNTTDTGLTITNGGGYTEVEDTTGVPRITSASALVGTSVSGAADVGLPNLPIKVEQILVRSHLVPPPLGTGVGEPVIFSILGDTLHPLPTDFSGYLYWSEPEYTAGVLPEFTFDSANWKETGANTGTQNEPGTPEGQWSTFPIAQDGQNTGTINCMDGAVDDSDGLNFLTSPEVVSVSVSSLGDTFVAAAGSQQYIATTNTTNAVQNGNFTVTQAGTGSWSETAANSASNSFTQTGTTSATVNASISVDDFVSVGASNAISQSQSVKQTAEATDSNTVGGSHSLTLSEPVAFTAQPGQTAILKSKVLAETDQLAAQAYPDANGNGVASGPLESCDFRVYYQPINAYYAEVTTLPAN